MPGIEWVNTLDNSSFIKSMNEVSSQVRQTKAIMEAMGTDVNAMFDKMSAAGESFKGTLRDIASLAGVAFSASQVKSFAQKVVETRSYFQDIESSMKVFLGSQEKAASFTKQLRDYAYFNMFDFSQLADASKQMIAYRHNVEDIIPRLDQLSNVARGTNAPLMEMVNAYNKAKNLGGLGGRELDSWAAKGLIIKDILKEMGETVNGNRVSFEQLNKVLDKVTGDGGMFHNLMGEQLSNISAEKGQLEDTLSAMYDEVGKKYEDAIVKWYKMGSELAENFVPNMEPILDKGAEGLEWLIDHYKEIGKVLGSIILTYGEWKASLALVDAYTNVRQKGEYLAQMEELDKEVKALTEANKDLISSKEGVKNADLAEMVAKKDLTEQQAKLIAAKKEELEQLQIDSEVPEYYDKIRDAKLRVLDVDLQDKVASEKLSLAQAQEIQRRREEIEAIDEEIRKRKELTAAKIEAKLERNDEDLRKEYEVKDTHQVYVNVAKSRINDIDNEIDRLQKIGAHEEDINRMLEERRVLQARIADNELIIEKAKERIAEIGADDVKLEKEKEELILKYGNDEEKLIYIKERRNKLEAELKSAKESSQWADKEYKDAVRAHAKAKKHLATLEEQLQKEREINAERAKRGENQSDTAGLEWRVNNAKYEEEAAGKREAQQATDKLAESERVEAIKKEIETINSRKQTIEEKSNKVAKDANSVSTSNLTLKEKLHSKSMEVSTKMSRIYKGAVDQVKNSIKSLSVAIETNPIGIFLGVISMALPWLLEFISGTDDAAESTENYENVAKEAASRVESLQAVIDSTSESSKSHRDAVEELAKIYEEYGIEVEKTKDINGKEIASVDSMREHHDELIAKLREEAIERQRLNDIKMADNSYNEEAKKLRKDVASDLSGEFNKSESEQLFNLVDEETILRTAEAVKKFNEAEVKGEEEIKAYNAALTSLNSVVEDYSNRLGKSGAAQDNAKKQMVALIEGLAKLKAEQMAAKKAADEAAKAAGGALSGQTDLSVKKEGIKDAAEEVANLYKELKEIQDMKANPEVKPDDAEKAAEDVEKAKEKIDELDEAQAKPEISSDDIKTATDDAKEAISGIEELSSSNAEPSVDPTEIENAISEANDAVSAVGELDMSEADPDIRDEQIRNAIEKTEKALSSMQNLDLAKAAPTVDILGYNNVLLKLLNLRKLLSDIAGQKVGEGEVQVNGNAQRPLGNWFEGQGKTGGNSLGNWFGATQPNAGQQGTYIKYEPKKQEERTAKQVTDLLAQKKKELADWREVARTEGEIQSHIAELKKQQASFTVGSKEFNFFKSEISATQAMTDKGREQAAKKAEQAAKKAQQAAKKRENEARKQAEDAAKRRQREFDLEQKRQEEELRQEQDTRAAIEKERIAGIKDEGERKRAEEEEQHRLNLQAIDNRIRDMKEKILAEKKAEWETKNKDKKTTWADTEQAKKGISNIEITKEQRQQAEADYRTENLRYAKIIEDRYKAEAESMRSFLREYGSYEQKKLALTQEYEEKIKKAQTIGEKASLTMKLEEEQEKLRSEEFQEQIDWSGVFSDLDGHTKEYLEGLKGQLQEILKTGNLPADQMKVIQDKINDINDELSEQGNMFDFVGDRTREHRRRLQEEADAYDRLAKAQEDESKARDGQVKADEKARTFAESVGIDGTLPISDISKKLDEESARLKQILNSGLLPLEQQAAVQERLNKINGEGKEVVGEAVISEGKLVKARQKTKDETEKAEQSKDAAAEEAADRIARKFADAAQWVNKYLGDLPALLDAVGLGSAGERVQRGIDAVNAAAGAAADFASGNYVGAALNGVKAVSSFGEAVGLWSNSNRAEIEKENERLAIAMNVNSEAVNRLTEAIRSQSPEEAYKSLEMATAALKANEEAARQTLINNANMFDGGHSLRHDLNDDYVKKIADYLGISHGKSFNIVDLLNSVSANDLGKLYGSKEGQNLLAGLGAAISEAEDSGNYNGLFQDLLDYINNFSDEAYDALNDTFQEAVANISFDSFKSGFKTSLMDMSKTAEDFSKDFTQQLMNSVLNAQIEQLYGKDMEDLYNHWVDAVRSGNALTEEEAKALMEEQDALAQRMMQTRDDIAKALDYGTEYKEYFTGLRDSWLSTLKDMGADGKSWKEQLTDQVFGDLIESTVLDVPVTVDTADGQRQFKDFAAYLEDWRKRYKAVIEGSYETEADRIAAINALIEEQTGIREKLSEQSKEIAAGLGKDMTEAFSNSLDNIGGTLLDALLDTEYDAEQMGKDIARTLISEMLTEMLASEKYADRMKAIRQLWQDILKGKDTEHTIEDVIAQITELNNEIAGDEALGRLAEQFRELGKAAEESPFKGLRDQFLSTIMDMEGDAGDFRKALDNIMLQDLIERRAFNVPFTINDQTFENFDKYLEDWNRRYTETLATGNEDLIGALLKELEDAREITISSVEELRERLSQVNAEDVADDTTFKELADNWADTLMDMSATAEDWADEVGSMMAKKVIQQMVVPTMIQPLLDSLQEVFNGVMEKAVTKDGEGNSVYNWDVILGSTELTDEIAKMSAEYPKIQSVIRNIMDAFGLDTSRFGGFSDLGGSIIASLSSAEDDIRKWSEDMGKAMAESMAQVYVDGKYKSQIDELNKQWKAALEAGDSDRIAGIEKDLESLYEAMGNDEKLQGLIDKFRELPENPFSNMRGTFLSSLLDMEADAEDFARDMTRILTEQMIDKVLEDGFQSRINGLGEEWSAALASGDRAAIERIKNEMVTLRGEMAEAVQPLLDTISSLEEQTDTTFKGMAGSWISALMDMETTAEEWAQNVGRTMAQRIIEELIAAKMIQPVLDEIQTAMDEALSVPGATWQSAVDAMTPHLGTLKDSFGELQPIVEQIMNAFGIFREAEEETVEEIKEGFSDLRGSIASSLMDMEADAGKFARDIARTMTGQMVESLIEKQFGSQMAALNEQWYNALESGDSAAMERIRQQVTELQKQCGEAVQPLLDALKEIERESDDTFTSMRDDFLSALMDMYAGTQDFVTDLKYLLTQKMVEKFVLNEQFDAWLKEFQGKYDAIASGTDMEQMAEEMDRLATEWARKAEELQEQTNRIFDVTGWATELEKMSFPLNDLRSSFRSSLMDMQSDAEGFAQNISDTLTEAFIDRFVLGEEFDKKLAEWQEQYAAIMRGNYSEEDRAILLKHLQTAITAAKDGYMEEAKAIQDLMGTSGSADQSASMNMADKATYDQFETYLGIAVAQQMATLQGNEVRQQILATLQSMSGISSPNGNTVREIRMMMNTTNEYLLDIRRSNRQILEQFGIKLDTISERLSRIL